MSLDSSLFDCSPKTELHMQPGWYRRGRPEIGAGSDASLPHFDHDGNLRSGRTVVAARSARTAIGVCPSRRSRFTVHYGPIGGFFGRSRMAAKGSKLLKELVELVGIEPTASSLRTTRVSIATISNWNNLRARLVR
jgi:hypothetical protein